MNPKVSVIIPTWNDSKNIDNAIKSVLNQSLTDIEVIVIDDGSTDGTKKILNNYINNREIIYLYQENSGPSISRQRGVSLSKGKYIAFIDDDDEWIDKNKLQKQVEFLDKNPKYVLIGTGVKVVDENGRELINYLMPETDYSIRKKILIKNCFVNSSIVVLRKVLNLVLNTVDQKGNKYSEDYKMWLDVGLLGKMYNLPEIMTKYTLRYGNISSLYKIQQIKNDIYLIRKHKNNYPHYFKSIIYYYIKLVTFYFLTKLPFSFTNKLVFSIKSIFYKIK